MRKSLFTYVFLLLSVSLKAQCPYPPCSCVDSSTINIYYPCSDPYDPVCACDGHTYRSECAAYHWGGISQYSANPFPYGPGPCGNFDFEFVPNPVVPESSDPNYWGYGQLSIYSKVAPVTALIQIYDIWGRVWYVRQEFITIPQSVDVVPNIYMDGFEQGIYIVYVIINGESQYKKILKANLH